MTAGRCVVLAEEAVPVADLDADSLEQNLFDLNETVSLTEDPLEKKVIERRIALAKAKYTAVSGKAIS